MSTVRVISGQSSSSISIAAQKPAAVIAIRKGGEISLQSLKNVVTTDLENGDTLVYDSESGNWIAQPVTIATIENVDGGTY